MTPTQARFNAIINSGVLSDRDVAFAKDLLASYNTKKVLSAGRRRCLDNLESKVANLKANPPTVDNSLVNRIATLAASTTRTAWERDILNSFVSQIKTGKSLSDKQSAIIEKIAIADSENAGWHFGDAEKEVWKVVIAYYRHNRPYFGDIVDAVDGNPNYIPTKRTFDKLTTNKHALAVLASHKADPKYNLGAIVSFNSNISSAYRAHALRSKLRALLPDKNAAPGFFNIANLSGIVLSIDPIIVSAGKGTKRYSILVFGASTPILVEERDLRLDKKANKKVKA
jgi:hypothetical protein